jgi:iron(III) transport system ATP-binding protein
MSASRKVPVEVRNVSLSYGATPVLHDVSVTIEPGEFFALLGASGSGKSTLLRVIGGVNDPQSGELLIGGKDVTRVPPWKRDVGMVFQNYALWPHLTVWQNVAFGLQERKLPRAVVRDRTAAALDLVGLGDYRDRRPNQLSGGQQQRVALARTVAIEPKVLLLDEPLSNLDAKLRVHMRGELLALQRKLGITTIFVTHDQEEALSVCDRIAVLDAGMIQQIGTPMELFDHPRNRFIADFVGSVNLLRGHVTRSADGTIFQSPGIGRLRLPAGIAVAAEGEVDLAFRPHAVTMVPGATPEASEDHLWLPGITTAREFLGEFVRYTVTAGGQSLVADQIHHAGAQGFAPGAAVHLGIPVAQLRILVP